MTEDMIGLNRVKGKTRGNTWAGDNKEGKES